MLICLPFVFGCFCVTAAGSSGYDSGLQTLKYFLPGPLQKIFTKPCPRENNFFAPRGQEINSRNSNAWVTGVFVLQHCRC